MKHTLQRLLPLLFFALLLLSCQDDANENSHEHDDGFGITYKHFKEFKNLPGLIESAVPKNGRSRTAKGGGMYDFVIDSTSVMEANSDQGTFYTMAITRDSLRGDIFENLVIADKDTVKEAYIITYFPDKEYLDDLEYNEHAPYIGGIKLTVLDYEKMVQRGGSTVEQCKNITISFCNYSRTNDGSYHVAGPNCGSIFWTWTGRLCETIFVPDPEPDEQFNLKDPKVGGGGGGGAIPGPPKDRTDVITQPIPPSMQKDSHEKNCNELKKMTDNVEIKGTFKQLETTTGENRENGYTFLRYPSGDVFYETERSHNPRMLLMQKGGKVIGQSHTHPTPDIEENVPMFSYGDVEALFKIARYHDNNGMPKDYSVYFVTLTVPSGTYAIKIDDFLAFSTAIGSRGNVINNSLYKKYQYIENHQTDKFIKAFLQILQKEKMGISLYKANNDFSSWDKVNCDKNNNIFYTNCK